MITTADLNISKKSTCIWLTCGLKTCIFFAYQRHVLLFLSNYRFGDGSYMNVFDMLTQV